MFCCIYEGNVSSVLRTCFKKCSKAIEKKKTFSLRLNGQRVIVRDLHVPIKFVFLLILFDYINLLSFLLVIKCLSCSGIHCLCQPPIDFKMVEHCFMACFLTQGNFPVKNPTDVVVIVAVLGQHSETARTFYAA